jgi:plastocyanin
MKHASHPELPLLFRLLRRIFPWVMGVGIFAYLATQELEATTFPVDVAPGGNHSFSPVFVSIQQGDTVKWTWRASGHTVTSGTPGHPSGLFDTGIRSSGFTFSFTFPEAGTFSYYCIPHGSFGMVGSVTVAAATPTPTPSPTPTPDPTVPAQALNVSTRLEVGTGDKVSIGGIIITEGEAKRVLLRAIGPSLANFGVTDPLPDPILELHAGDGTLMTTNDNWKDSPDMMDIEATGLAPTNDFESSIIRTLDPGLYTAVVNGKNGATGVGLVEAYDLDLGATSQLGNLSTRGFVGTDTNVMIGGFILGGGGKEVDVVARALGPSLTAFGVTGALADPTLELHDENGALVKSNDNWQDEPAQAAEIEATGLQPTDDLESAIFQTLAPGAYTAIVSGSGGLTGVALVEVYRLP